MDVNTDLKTTIEKSVQIVLEQMKTCSAEDRFHLAMEFNEWLFNDIDSDDELLVPTDLGA